MPLRLDTTGGVTGKDAGEGLAMMEGGQWSSAPFRGLDEGAWDAGFSVVVAYDEEEDDDDGDFAGDEDELEGDEEEYFDEDEEFEDDEDFDDDGDEDEDL